MILTFSQSSDHSEAIIVVVSRVLQAAVLVNCYTFAFNAAIINHIENTESRAHDVIRSRIVASQVTIPKLQAVPLPRSKQCLVYRPCTPCHCPTGTVVPNGPDSGQMEPPSPKRSAEVPANPPATNYRHETLPPIPPNRKSTGEREPQSELRNPRDSGGKMQTSPPGPRDIGESVKSHPSNPKAYGEEVSLNTKGTRKTPTATKGSREKIAFAPKESGKTVLAASSINGKMAPGPGPGVKHKKLLRASGLGDNGNEIATHRSGSAANGSSISMNGNNETTISTKASNSNKPEFGTNSSGSLGKAVASGVTKRIASVTGSAELMPSGQDRRRNSSSSSESLARTGPLPVARNETIAPTKQPLETTFMPKDTDCNDDSGDLDIAAGDVNGKAYELTSEVPRRPCGKSAVLVVAKPGTPKKRKYFPWIPGRGPKPAPDDLDIAIGDEEGNKVTVIPYDAPDPGMEELIDPSGNAAVNGGSDVTPESPAPGLDNQNSDAPNTEIQELPNEVPNSDLSQTQNEPLPTDEGNAENEVNAPEDANVSGGAESEPSTDHEETTDQDLPPADSDSGLTESNPPEVSAETGDSQSQPSPDSGENPTEDNGNLSGPEDSNNPNEGTEVGGTAELLPKQPEETRDGDANSNTPPPPPNDSGSDANLESQPSSDTGSGPNAVLPPVDIGNVSGQDEPLPESGSTSPVSVNQQPIPEPNGNLEDLSANQTPSEPSDVSQPISANEDSVSANVPLPEGPCNDPSTQQTRSIRRADSAALPLDWFRWSHRIKRHVESIFAMDSETAERQAQPPITCPPRSVCKPCICNEQETSIPSNSQE